MSTSSVSGTTYEELASGLLRGAQEQGQLFTRAEHHETRIGELEGGQGALQQRVGEVIVGQEGHAAQLEDFGATLAELQNLARANDAFAHELVGGLGELAAGQVAHHHRIEELAEGIRANGKGLAAAQAEREALNGRVDGVRGDVDAIGAEVNAQAQQIQGVRGDVNDLRGAVNGLNGRADAIEGDQAQQAAAQAQANAQIQALQDQVNQQEAQIGAQQANIVVLREHLEDNGARMAQAEGVIEGLRQEAEDGAAQLQRARVEVESARQRAKYQAVGAVACAGTIAALKFPIYRVSPIENILPDGRFVAQVNYLEEVVGDQLPSGVRRVMKAVVNTSGGHREFMAYYVPCALGAAGAGSAWSAHSNHNAAYAHMFPNDEEA